jgi:hypothetical protein
MLALLFAAGAWTAGPVGLARSDDICKATTSPLTIDPTLPGQLGDGTPSEVNCFAWKTFIALNWTADSSNRGQPISMTPTPADFGDPKDDRATVWQTYRLTSDVFREAAAAPVLWNTPDALPGNCGGAPSTPTAQRFALSTSLSLSKFGDRSDLLGAPADADERLGVKGFALSAEASASPPLVIDQAGNPVQYEQRINHAEYTYIDTNHLYDFSFR